MATQTKTASKAAKPAARKKPARKPAPKPDPVIELTPIDDGVNIKIEEQVAEIKIAGTFDLDGLIAVSKRVNRARAALS